MRSIMWLNPRKLGCWSKSETKRREKVREIYLTWKNRKEWSPSPSQGLTFQTFDVQIELEFRSVGSSCGAREENRRIRRKREGR